MIRKGQLICYGRIHRIDSIPLTKRIFDVVENSVKKANWFQVTEEDLKHAGIDREMINERHKFKNKILSYKCEVEER